jgi:acetate kinase
MHSICSNSVFALNDIYDGADVEVKHQDDALDEALRESFPASDPIAVCFTGVKGAKPSALIINGGSSSIKFAIFESDESLLRILEGKIEGVGSLHGNFSVKGMIQVDNFSRPVALPDHRSAVNLLMDWLEQRIELGTLGAVGHRVVHGGPKYWEPQRITPEMIENLRQLSPFDPEHMQNEILLINAFHCRFPNLTQITCFDTAFHHDMPRVARLLPLPRRYDTQGVRRYGFHGISYAYLMQELERIEVTRAASARVILAHLGNGASMAAVHEGKCMDTTMALTPASGLMMGTRCGDIDPGLVSFLARNEKMTASQFDCMANRESGLLGVSETSADMRDLLARETDDVRAAEAVALFCYQAKKWIGAYAAVLGGVDTLVFSGGIGENAAPVRARICDGLGFLGIELDASRNTAIGKTGNVEDVISKDCSRVTVRVIRTDEELMIAQSVFRLLGIV